VASAAVVNPKTGSWCLIDPSPDIVRQIHELQRIYGKADLGFENLDVFVTHIHLGHYWGLGFFGKEGLGVQGVRVFSGDKATAFFKANHPFRRMEEEGRLHFKTIGPDRPWKGFVEIEAVPVPHRSDFSETFAFRISGERGTVFYMPDTDLLPQDLTEQAGNADYAFLDGTFYSPDEIPGLSRVPHPPVQETVRALAQDPAWKAKVVFTHLNHTNPLLLPRSPQRRELEEAGFHVADDWDAVPL
jgi:pyrroloquinoline quinone biosynthesis protein B